MSWNKPPKCTHYLRWCIPICTECQRSDVNCHHCHNEIADHVMDRHKVTHMKCLLCNCYQKLNEICKNPECYPRKHRNFCGKCALWDDKANKNIYHCDKCGICRVGRDTEYKHCDKCNVCWDKRVYETHTCKINQMGRECLICLENCWDSQESSGILKCGHSFHRRCINNWLKQSYKCPYCSKTAVDPTMLWTIIEQYVNASVLPDECKDWTTLVSCNDCEKQSETSFHPAYHKCGHCGGWNTQTIKVNKPQADAPTNT